MKVAVSAAGRTLDAQLDPRFGRCAYFLIVDPATMAFDVVENAGMASAQGAGIATAQMIAANGVEAVLTGNCGPNAYQVLEAAKVQVVSGVTGTVREAVLAHKEGRLQPAARANVASHHGMGAGQGRGMGGGMGGAMAARPQPSAPAGGSDAIVELMQELKGEMDALRAQVSDINRRIDELHKKQ